MIFILVVVTKDETCNVHSPVILTSPTGYLPSVVTMETGRGGRECPWRIYVHPDQQINVTLLNFARVSPLDESGHFAPVRSRICYQLAVIRERQFVRVVTECEGSARVSHVYMSSYNVIDIDFIVTKSSDFYFLFYYEGDFHRFLFTEYAAYFILIKQSQFLRFAATISLMNT